MRKVCMSITLWMSISPKVIFCYPLYIAALIHYFLFFFFQAEDGIRDYKVTGVQTCALPIFTARVRPPANPDFCRRGSDHPSAKVFPMEQSNRHLSMYDPARGSFTLISTCFPTHHLNFAEDANQTLWVSSGVGGNQGVGWLNRKIFGETDDEAKAQGWTPFIVDTNG